ncbi:hypothetical protein CKJ85_03975 [Corynebacterium sp. NML 150383]|uniref:hypothetical protein n=1 Tax=Corynebacterium TaxID=1716 RepID=UPI000BAA939D|nr:MULTISPECIES: hypothetical protein [Corynebacterium]MCG7254592.1 hypothetical protein [Corynebacterium hadale]MCG7256157.1 hypothetical protein [Corynebacterium hadale]MCG7265994.1 hypothetical protein [Corynebacterium hadale]PAT03969.1 hypothetical protein CKJ85_03975 [Corynebacterium sp. NML 150383]
MAVHFSIDLTDATYADLVALVEGARVAGVDKRAALHLEDTTLSLEVEPEVRAERGAARGEHAPATGGQLPQLGDAAIRSVVDILTGRQEPPRR